MYTHPFSAPYWQDASRELRDLRKLLFAALMIALCIVLAQVPSVPLFGGAKVTWGFLARSVCAWICGPVLGLLCILRYTIQGAGFTNLAMLSGVSEMVARILVSVLLVPAFGYTAVCFGDSTAWVFADAFLIPAFVYVYKRIKLIGRSAPA